MRLLLAISGLHPRDGGPPRVVLGSAIALVEQGHDVTVLSNLAPADENAVNASIARAKQAGVQFVFVDAVGPARIWFPPRTGRLVEAVNAADVVHCHGVWSPLLLTIGRVARSRQKPYFVSSHGLFSPWAISKSRLKKQIATALFGIGRFLGRARGVIFGTRGEHEVSTVPGARVRPIFVPNGVAFDTGTQPVTEQQRERLLAAAPPVRNWSRTILFFSRIHPKKGLDMLVAAFAEISARYPGAGLLIAGLPEDRSYQEAIERRIAERPHVPIILTTDLVGEGSQFLYAAADIFALPSHEEGFSMALLESLAFGCPSLSTTLCHLPEIAERGAGVVVDPNMQAIAKGLAQLLDQGDAELAAMRTRARALFEERFTWGSVARQLTAVYEQGAPA